MKRRCCVWMVLFLLVAFAMSAAQVAPNCVPPPAGMVSWWPGEGNADDYLGHSPGILQNGVSFVPGKVGQAFQLDGIDDFVLVTDEEPFDFGDRPFSIAVWVQTLGGRGFNEHIVSKGNVWTGGDDYVLWVSVGEGGVGHVKLQLPGPQRQ